MTIPGSKISVTLVLTDARLSPDLGAAALDLPALNEAPCSSTLCSPKAGGTNISPLLCKLFPIFIAASD
jgi:hypothetical protein